MVRREGTICGVMSTPLLIAVIITIFMVAAHIGVFWWFVLRESAKKPQSGANDSEGKS